MNFLDWFRFSPRAGREEYVFINACCQLGSLAIYIAQSIFSMKTFSWQGVVFNLMIDLVILVLSLGIFWVFLAVSFRRMHDLNMPGWWFILCLIVINHKLIIIVATETPKKIGDINFTDET